MTRDPVFRKLSAETLVQLAKTLKFDPLANGRLLSQLNEAEQLVWMNSHRDDLEDHLSFVGSSLLS